VTKSLFLSYNSCQHFYKGGKLCGKFNDPQASLGKKAKKQILIDAIMREFIKVLIT
jgi:hypothetical protein